MSSPETPQRPRVLLIDDDPISRDVLAMMLEMHGFPVESAADGTEALSLIKTGASACEVILMDTQMPGISGLELIRTLRLCSQAKIIAISGSAADDSIRDATDGFLLKPIAPEALIALLDSAPAPETQSATVAANAPTTEAVIDPSVLGKLKAMMPASAVREIYAVVASDMKPRLVSLKSAIDAGDAVEVARIAHIIKGGCSMVGLRGATEAAARLETSNMRGTWPKELLQLHFALGALESILGDGLLR